MNDLSDNKLSDRQDEHATKTAYKAAELFHTDRSYINDAATHESGDFGVCDNKLSETNQDERKAAHKTCETAQLIAPSEKDERSSAHQTAELVLTSRKTGWLTSFSPCTKPTALHVVFDIFYSTICSALTIRFCGVTDTSLTVTLLKSATKLPGRG